MLLKWVDLDLENKIVRITPEKGGNPRLLKMSDRLLTMLNDLPKDQSKLLRAQRAY